MLNRLPPRLVRRLVLAPFVLLLSLFLLAISPALLLLAAVADIVLPGNWRTVRLIAFGVGYLALEVVGLVGMFVLWVGSGFGARIDSERSLERHYNFMRWWLLKMNKIVMRVARLKVVIEERPEPRPGPVLVFCRHAGPGNSLLLIGTIMIGYLRHPRIVMLAKLQWEPMFDIMLNRLPNRFIKHDPTKREVYINAIADLATGLTDRDAFVLFPEGKDFTPRVRRRAIEYLKRKGHDAAAARAEKMEHVLPPRHGGVAAAIRAAPDADVVLVAHSVLEDIGSFKELWSRLPFERPVVARYWRFPVAEVPTEEAELLDWLYEWWERIDRWIVHHEQQAAEQSATGPAR